VGLASAFETCIKEKEKKNTYFKFNTRMVITSRVLPPTAISINFGYDKLF